MARTRPAAARPKGIALPRPPLGKTLGPAAAVGIKSKVRATPGTTTYRRKPVAAPPAKPSLLDEISRGIGERIDTITGKRGTPIRDSLRNPPVPQYVRDKLSGK